MPIRILPPQLIDQIAAGEVIERPASIVKELVENAFDAGAQHIEIDIERSGLGLIRVRDDGSGIDAAELPLAALRHATSKIETLEDLAAVTSFGFRGEALPSIASVARVRLISRRRGSELGYELALEAAECSGLKPAAHPVGTSVEVRDLFYNVPARRKFMRSESTEFGHILRQLERLALSMPAVGLHVRHNGKDVLDLPGAADGVEAMEHRLERLLGAQFRRHALPIDVNSGAVRLMGWLGAPTAARGQPDLQFWFVNSRVVRDRLLGNAVRLGYRDVLYHGRHPCYVLYLSLDPREVDVNAHPSKLELRFRDSRGVHDAVFRSIERALAATKPTVATALAAVLDGGASGAMGAELTAEPRAREPNHPTTTHYLRSSFAAAQALSAPAPAPSAQLPHAPEQALGIAIAQLHGLYILAQNQQGLIIVDAHAAHERVLYEQLKRDYESATPASQMLLEPLRVQLAEHEIDALLAERDELERLGFEIERYAPERLAVRRVPVLLARTDLAQLLAQLGRELTGEAGINHLDGAAQRILGSIACRAAIRGQRMLSHAEMDTLLRQMEQTERASQCNHGRPTWRCLSLQEIDQLFLRGR